MNTRETGELSELGKQVQIPLWSMNTIPIYAAGVGDGSSDSSMVDEYHPDFGGGGGGREFRFLYGRWIHRARASLSPIHSVQIPLWSMNTPSACHTWLSVPGSDSSMVDEYKQEDDGFEDFVKFRFLYGRWIPCARVVFMLFQLCSDSSMVDEY